MAGLFYYIWPTKIYYIMFLNQYKKGNHSLSSYVPALVLIIIVFIAAQSIAGIILAAIAGIKNGGVDAEALKTMDFGALGISSNLGFLILIGSFLPAFFGLRFAKVFHKRPFLSFVTARKKLDYKRLAFGMLVWGLILIVFTLIDFWMDPENYIVTFDAKTFIPLIIIALIFFPFQIAFEEILFRGYLYQLFGHLFKYPIISWIITSVLFGLMHSSNPEVQEYGFWVMMPSYILLGAFLGLITVLDDGLELALGIHFINNLFLGIGVNYAGSAIKVNSAFQVLSIDPTSNWYVILISGALFIFIAWRKYKFNGVSKLLNR